MYTHIHLYNYKVSTKGWGKSRQNKITLLDQKTAKAQNDLISLCSKKTRSSCILSSAMAILAAYSPTKYFTHVEPWQLIIRMIPQKWLEWNTIQNELWWHLVCGAGVAVCFTVYSRDRCSLPSVGWEQNVCSLNRQVSSQKSTIDWCCFYYFVRNSLVALLEGLCAHFCVLFCVLSCVLKTEIFGILSVIIDLKINLFNRITL